MEVSWGVVVPVKRLALAKTRLAAYGDATREELALAMAADVVRAAVSCPVVVEVLVVTDDERAGPVLAALGARVVPDDPDAGLNPALAHGAELLRLDDPERGVATLSSDLPALGPAALADVLGQVRRRGFVADADGTGTTLLAAAPGSELVPAFGPGSAAAHEVSGAVRLMGGAGLRRDVDTPDDLADAVALGVGPATATVVDGLR